MRIVVTGVPGTGKTVVCKALAKKLKHKRLSLNEVVEKYKMYHRIDEDGCKVADIKLLSDYVRNILTGERDIIVEGHLACEFGMPADVVVVLRTHPRVLEKRLSKRGYSRRKIGSNVVCELLDYCVTMCEKHYAKDVKLIEVNTTNKSPERVALEIIEIIKGKRRKRHIDWGTRLYKKGVDFAKVLERMER